MNARTPFPPSSTLVSAPSPRAQRADQEFLPAALEVLETPPSPIGIWLIWIICLLAAAALTWAYFGRLDIVATAQGKIQPTGRVKVVQPVEAGRIVSVHVENGRRVGKGDPLVTFDSGETDADVNELSANLGAYRAEVARRQAALQAVVTRDVTTVPPIPWDDTISPTIKLRETHVLEGDLSQLASALSGLRAQQRQKRLEQERFKATVDASETLVATLQQRVDMRATLAQSGSGSKAELINATETLLDRLTALATTRGQLAESAEAIEVLGHSIEDSYRTFAAQNLQKLAEAERQADDVEQRLAKALVRQRRTVLASPIDGTISGLSITTLGQVVAAGDEIMRVVPDGIGIEIECYIPNRDIGFVHLGQEAIVKIESLPFTRYGTVRAELRHLAGDAIPEPDADQMEANSSRAIKDRGFAGAQRTQNLVFPATLRLDATSVVADGAKVPLSPGMAVTVEIKTGSRRILEYVFSPLVEVAAQAMKER